MDRVSAFGAEWIPARIRWTEAGPMVDWCHLGDLRFTDPFFAQTINRAMAHPFNLLFQRSSPLETLSEQVPELRPAGLIFHMTRCGSTLVTQMLASLPANVALSEPSPIDHVLRAPAGLPGVTADRIVGWLRAVTAALGRRRHKEQRDFVIKLDGWHALVLPLIRRAFPDVPWAFLYRRPVEVLGSIGMMPPYQMLPGGIDPALVGLSRPQALAMSLDRYAALVLERICRAAIEHHARANGLLIEYRELPDAMAERLLAHFGLDCDAAALARMREIARFDAKQPTLHYSDDSAAKRDAATPEMHELAETSLMPLYAQLEKLRTV
jgi:hypothetical protein